MRRSGSDVGFRMPDFIVIGAMKSGTSSLASYLAVHPDVFMPKAGELDYFSTPGNWSRGLRWYANQFEAAGEDSIVGERSTSYTKHPVFTGAASRIYDILPKARLIYLVRDPIDRVVSHYRHQLVRGREARSLRVALHQDDHYLVPSRYGAQLERYLVHFDRSQLLVLYSEHLHEHRAETVHRALVHVGVDLGRAPQSYSWTRHATSQVRHPLPYMERLRRSSLYRKLTPKIPERIKSVARRWTTQGVLDFDPRMWELDRTTRQWLQSELDPEIATVRELAGPTPWSWAEP